MSAVIAVVDYGMGNLKSVVNAFDAIGRPVTVTTEPADLDAAMAIVVPGVGAFCDGIGRLRERGIIDALHENVVARRKPFLGICLGMQFLATQSFEHGQHEGLGWIRGNVIRLQPGDPACRVPSIGWNDLQITGDCPLLADLDEDPIFYFVHSYHLAADPEDSDAVKATCWHGQPVAAVVQKQNIFGVQFHPEKSQRAGLNLLRNFANLA